MAPPYLYSTVSRCTLFWCSLCCPTKHSLHYGFSESLLGHRRPEVCPRALVRHSLRSCLNVSHPCHLRLRFRNVSVPLQAQGEGRQLVATARAPLSRFADTKFCNNHESTPADCDKQIKLIVRDFLKVTNDRSRLRVRHGTYVNSAVVDSHRPVVWNQAENVFPSPPHRHLLILRLKSD